MTPPEADRAKSLVRDPVEELAEDFLERYRRGERPTLSEFTARAPEHAEEIRELFPALVLLEQADPAAAAIKVASPAACHVERLGDYHLLREVGRGGMGIVYEAEQEALGRHVALKILSFPTTTDPRCLARFRREARSAARLHHTNIVPVFDIGEREGVHYYAMQFIHGQGLDEVIAELRRLRPSQPAGVSGGRAPEPAPGLAADLAEGMLSGQCRGEDLATGPASPSGEGSPPSAPGMGSDRGGASDGCKQSVLTDHSDFSTKSDFHFYRSVGRIGLQVAEALAYAHGQRVLHRDIKPSNLLLDAHGSVWVTDFGLAKEEGDALTRTGDVVGTLRYMAPERLNGVSEARSDVYGLGLTLYELLTLRPAFPETDRVRLVQRITRQEPVAPRRLDSHIPRDLETIVLKAIAKEPARRYATAEAMAEDLRRFLTDRPIRARRTSQWEHTWRWCRRNPGWASTVATVLGLLLVIAVGGSVLNLHLRRALNDVQAADREKTDKLWQSYLERARALRSSGRVGQRFEALKVIREAAKIKVTPELRDEAVASLVLPDVELAREWEGHPEGTLDLAYDANFERYARINTSGELTVCRLGDKGEEVVAQLPIQGRRPSWGLWMSPDGRFLAYGYGPQVEGIADGVRIWKLDGPTPVVFRDEPAGVHLYALSFHPDGRRLAIGHVDGTISVYDLGTNAPPRRLPLGVVPNSLAFHPRDGRLAVACGESIRLFDVDSWTELPALRDPQIRTWSFGMAWHPQGRLLAATSGDTKIHVWDTQAADEVMDPLEGHPSAGVFMAFNHAGDRLISTGWDRQTRLWDAVSGRLLLVMPGRFGAQFSRDDSTIGLGRSGTKLSLWRLADGRELRQIRRPKLDGRDALHPPVLDTDGRILAAASLNVLCFFDLASGRELASVRMGETSMAFPRSFDRLGGWMTSGSTGAVLWPAQRDPVRPNVLRIGPPRLLAKTIHYGADATSDGRVRVIPQHAENLKNTRTLVLDRDRPGRRVALGPQYDVRHAAVSPDGQWVATCSWFSDRLSRSVRIWAAATGRHVTDLPIEGQSYAGFSPDGRWLAVHTNDQGCQLWEVGTWRAGKRFEDASFCWSPDKRFLVVNDVPGTIRFVEPETAREALRLTGPDASRYAPACLTPDGTTLIAQAADLSALYVWDLRKIRVQLKELELDWELPEFPSVPPSAPRDPPAVELDPGILRRPVFKNDRHTVAAFSLLLTLQPINPEAYFRRGLACEELEESAQAVKDFEMFLALAPKDDRRRLEIQIRLATNYRNLDDARRALEALVLTADAHPELIPWPTDYAKLCNSIAWRYVRLPVNARLPDSILRVARRAVELEHDNPMYQNTLGAALYRTGRYEEAIHCLEGKLELSQLLAAFDLYFLAMSYERLGQSAKARTHFDRADAAARAEVGLSAGHRAELAGFRAEAESLLRITKSK